MTYAYLLSVYFLSALLLISICFTDLTTQITRGTLSASAGVSRIFLAVCYLRVMPSASPVFPLIENCGGFFFW